MHPALAVNGYFCNENEFNSYLDSLTARGFTREQKIISLNNSCTTTIGYPADGQLSNDTKLHSSTDARFTHVSADPNIYDCRVRFSAFSWPTSSDVWAVKVNTDGSFSSQNPTNYERPHFWDISYPTVSGICFKEATFISSPPQDPINSFLNLIQDFLNNIKINLCSLGITFFCG